MEPIYVALFVAYFSINSFVAGTFIERGLTDSHSYNKVKFALSCAFIVLFAIPAFACIHAFYFLSIVYSWLVWRNGPLIGVWWHLIFTDRYNIVKPDYILKMRAL